MLTMRLWAVTMLATGALLGVFCNELSGLILGSFTGLLTGVCFVAFSRLSSRMIGQALGWAVSGPLSFTIGGGNLFVLVGRHLPPFGLLPICGIGCLIHG